MLYKVLTNLGLTEKESTVYLTLLELGTASAFDISKQNKIPYSTVHVNLNNLEQKGLITKYEQNKTSRFSIIGPDALTKYINKKKKELDDQTQELENAFSELTAIYSSSQAKPRIKLYCGKDSVESIERDADNEFDRLNAPTVYSFTPIDILDEFDPIDSTVDRRLKRGQKLKIIYTHQDGIQNLTDPAKLREARFLSREQFPFNSMIVIAPNHSIRLYSFRDNFIGIWIDDRDMANTLKTIFDICWRRAQKEK